MRNSRSWRKPSRRENVSCDPQRASVAFEDGETTLLLCSGGEPLHTKAKSGHFQEVSTFLQNRAWFLRRHLTSPIKFNLQNPKSLSWSSVSGPKKSVKSQFNQADAPLRAGFGANMHLSDGSSLSYSHFTAISCFCSITRSPALCPWD